MVEGLRFVVLSAYLCKMMYDGCSTNGYKECSMSIEQLYDKVAKTYNQELSANVLDEANGLAFEYIQDYDKRMYDILSLGVGDGHFMLPFKEHYPEATLHGLDISSQMLQKAHDLLGCQTYHGDIADASLLIEESRFDLVVAHFVCAYVAKSRLLAQCQKLLNQDGLLSIVTNTYQSFPQLRARFDDYVAKDTFFRRKIKQHMAHTLETVHVPHDIESLKAFMQQNDFEIEKEHVTEIEVSFASAKEFYDFFINGGWFISGVIHRYMPMWLLKRFFYFMVQKNIDFPFSDTLTIAIVLGRFKQTR